MKIKDQLEKLVTKLLSDNGLEINWKRKIKNKGNLISDLQAQIKALNIDDLEQLAEDFLDFNSIDDLQEWLVNL